MPTPTGSRAVWGTSTLDRLLRNEAYIGRTYFNRTETVPDGRPGHRSRQVPRPRADWIAIPCPAIITDQLDPAQRQDLLRLLIEDVQVTGWHIQIRLRIPLDDPPDGGQPDHPGPPSPASPDTTTTPVSTEDRLRSLHAIQVGKLPASHLRP